MSFVSVAIGSAVGLAGSANRVRTPEEQKREALAMQNDLKHSSGVHDIARGVRMSNHWRCAYCTGQNDAKEHSCLSCGAAQCPPEEL